MTAVKCILLGMLALFTMEDLRTQKLSLTGLSIFGTLGLLLVFGGHIRSPLDVLGGVCMGAFLLAVSLAGRGGVGIGDGLLFCVTGIFLGFWENAALLMLALLIAAVCAGVLLAAKRCGKKRTFAFAPCVLAAYLLLLAG